VIGEDKMVGCHDLDDHEWSRRSWIYAKDRNESQ
jgi:hypothetical protein